MFSENRVVGFAHFSMLFGGMVISGLLFVVEGDERNYKFGFLGESESKH